MTLRQWQLLIADSFRVESRARLKRERGARRLKRQLKRIHRQRRRDRKARLRAYGIGWCHAQAIRDDKVRTIRLELERRHQAHLDRKVVRFIQGGQVG